MTETTSARDHILKRLRLATVPFTASAAGAQHGCDRRYRHAPILPFADRITLFEDCLREYGTSVQRVPSEAVGAAIEQTLAHYSKVHVVVPKSLPGAWIPEGTAWAFGDSLSARELDRFDSVVTGCTVAVAVSGSIVLQNADAQGPRRLSLIPDFHLCVVFAGQIVETLPEAFARLAPTVTLPTTFISGPSATSDIEMTRIRGVHGPRTFSVLIALPHQLLELPRLCGSEMRLGNETI